MRKILMTLALAAFAAPAFACEMGDHAAMKTKGAKASTTASACKMDKAGKCADKACPVHAKMNKKGKANTASKISSEKI